MKAIDPPGEIRPIGAPKDWDHGQVPVGTLMVRDDEVAGVPVIVSHWQPSIEERMAIAAGAPIALWVLGRNMPPVSLEIG